MASVSRLRGLLGATIALATLCGLPGVARAGVFAGGATTTAAVVTVGQADVPVSITLTNQNTAPDTAATNTVCNADETFPCFGGLNEKGITFVPSCGSLTMGDCINFGLDPGVFRVSPAATGRAGSACAGMTFAVALTDVTSGTVRFTPQPSANVTLVGAGSACTIDFTQSVVKLPAIDADPAATGIQTLQVTSHRQTSGDASGQGKGSTFVTVQPAPDPGSGGAAAAPPFPAKLEVARALVSSGSRRLDVLAPISARASGRVSVRLRAAGRTTSFTAPVDSANAWVRISRPIPAAQARAGTGILTIAYPGDADTQPQEVRLRAASRKALLVAGRPAISGGRLIAAGRISSAARGVVRVQLLFEPAGQATRTLQLTARIANGRYGLNATLPMEVLAQIAGRRGVVHSYTLFTGYRGARMRGELASFEVLPAP